MTDEFTEKLLDQIRAGHGFVPLIGSGLSAASGIPTGEEFGNYLFLHLDRIIKGKLAWDPKDPCWLPLERADVSQISDETRKTTATKWLEMKEPFYLEAIGALADWRTALTFLSRLPPHEATRKIHESGGDKKGSGLFDLRPDPF